MYRLHQFVFVVALPRSRVAKTPIVATVFTQNDPRPLISPVGAYLDMASVIHTAQRFDLVENSLPSFDKTLKEYQRIGLIANEWNRDMGLLDLVPEIFSPKVVEKMKYVDSLRQR